MDVVFLSNSKKSRKTRFCGYFSTIKICDETYAYLFVLTSRISTPIVYNQLSSRDYTFK